MGSHHEPARAEKWETSSAETEDLESESDEMDDDDFASEIDESDAENERDDDRSGTSSNRIMRRRGK